MLYDGRKTKLLLKRSLTLIYHQDHPNLATIYHTPHEVMRVPAVFNQKSEKCRSKGFIVRSDVEMELGVSQSTAILLLRELTDEGVLMKKGKTINLRYYENK